MYITVIFLSQKGFMSRRGSLRTSEETSYSVVLSVRGLSLFRTNVTNAGLTETGGGPSVE